jgi:hypothetical protein
MDRHARFVSAFVWASSCLFVNASAVEPKFPLGRETTYVDGPLDEEGYVDYAEALNLHYGRGVTPENNAHALLWTVIGPGSIDPAIRAKHFQQLGVDMPPEKGNYFVTLQSFVEGRASGPDTYPLSKAAKAALDQLALAGGRPWTAAEFPQVAAWLNANGESLTRMEDGLKRPEYFRPVVAPSTPEGRGGLLESLIPGLAEVRDLAKAFAARALLRTTEGKFAEAWDDLLRCRRLGCYVSRGPMLVDLLVGISIEAMAARAEAGYVASRKWTAASAVAHVRDLDALPPMSELADKIDRAERFTYLDAVRQVRRAVMDPVGGAVLPGDPAELRKMAVSADYEPALRSGNRWYGRLAGAARLTERAARQAEFERIDADLKSLTPRGKLERFSFSLGLAAGTPATRGERIGELVTVMMLPNVSYLSEQTGRTAQSTHNVKIAIGLAAYRDEVGRYPTTLDELVPSYLAAVPIDLFAERPPVYRVTATGYLLYSIGPNGKDDDGRTHEDDPGKNFDRDDISIRMPIP